MIPSARGNRPERLAVVLGLVLALGIVLGVSLGAVRLPVKEAFRGLLGGPARAQETCDTAGLIIWTLRFPRVLLAMVEGAALAGAGAVMQGLFRNPMADPYVLGVSSGASLGAVVGLIFGVGRALGLWALPALAFAGAMASTGAVYSMATHRGRTDTWTLLLSGIAISSLISSVIAFLMVLSRERVDEIVFWTMGTLSRATWSSVIWSFVYTVPGLAVLCFYARDLNAMSFGEEPAFHMGVPVEKTKRTLLWTASLVTAGGVAFTGPIGFVGLIVPHVVRLLAGPDHRWLLPLSALLGGNTLLFADLLARTIAPPREIPVGVITSLFGAPFFLRLLFKTRRGRG